MKYNTETAIQDLSLSKREMEILIMVSKGMISKEISNSLFISINTVNNHRQKILRKLNTKNVIEAINYAKELGLLN